MSRYRYVKLDGSPAPNTSCPITTIATANDSGARRRASLNDDTALSVRMPAWVKRVLQRAAARRGFSASSFVRFVICNVLAELGEISEEMRYKCLEYGGLAPYTETVFSGEDPELLVALENVVMMLGHEVTAQEIKTYAEELMKVYY